MKISFHEHERKLSFHESAGREEPHDHEITPWVYPSTPWTGNPEYHPMPASPGDPMQWSLGCISKGFIRELFRKEGRTYVVTLEFEDAELENWLESYIVWKPKKALDLLVKMLPKAWDKLKEKG